MKTQGINTINTNFMASRKRIATTGIKIAMASFLAKEATDVFEKRKSYEEDMNKIDNDIVLGNDEFEDLEDMGIREDDILIDNGEYKNLEDLDMANSGTFRDQELFNPYLDDERDMEYSQYDENDLPVQLSMLNPFTDINVRHNSAKILEIL